MFYSNDLLTLRGGGKFNLIWLLSTTSDKASLARKRKGDLLSLNYKNIVEELEKLFPVTGKKTSLSLRTSAILMHGIFISFKLRADFLNNDTIKLLATTTRVNGRRNIDTSVATTSRKTDIALEEYLDLTRFGEVKEVADTFQELNLEPEEISARQRAVTMVEADLPPRIEDEWSFSNGTDLPMVPDIEAIEEMRSIFDEPVTTNPPPTAGNIANAQTEAMELDDPRLHADDLNSILHPGGQDDVNSDIAAPPVKPRIGSNPRIEVTPAITEERQSRISPVHIIPEQPNMDVDDTSVVNDVFRPPDMAQGEEQPYVPDDNGPVIHPPEDVPLPAVEVGRGESLSSMELSPVRSVPKKRKRKAVLCIHVDQETQIPGDQVKAQMQNYTDLLRPQEDETARISRPRMITGNDKKIEYPRVLGNELNSLLMEAQDECANTDGNYYWDEEIQPPMDPPPEVEPDDAQTLEVPPRDVSEMRDESNLRRESFNESSVLNPQGNLHSTMVDAGEVSTAKPQEDILMEDIQEESHQDGLLQPPVGEPILSPPRVMEAGLVLDPLPVLSPSRNVTVPEQEEEGAPAAAPGNITSPTGYDEFTQGLSQRFPEVGTVDEGFDETTSTLAFGEALKSRIGGRKEGRFSDLVDDNMSRRDVAKTFLQMLVSNKQQRVEVTQDICYGEIRFLVS